MTSRPSAALDRNVGARTGRRGRRKGVAVRPGAVKQARLDAGLSLGQVARGDISRTAIYFVETGKAKPSMETLRLIADRTGRPLDFFLAEPATAPLAAAEMAELERLMAAGDNVGAAARSEHLMGQRLDAESEARVKLIAALAYLRLAQPVPGRRYATAARLYFESAGDRLRLAEALGTEAQGAYLMHEPSALPLAQSALETLRSLKSYPQWVESRLLIILASVRLNERDWTGAIEDYQRALAAGDEVQDLHQLSLLYSGLSYAYQESGHLDQATRYAKKALTIHETLNDRISLARSLNNVGYMLVGLKDFASARRHIRRAMRIFDEDNVELGKSNLLMSLCEVEYGCGDVERARELAAEAATLAAKLGEMSSEVYAHSWLGRIAADDGDDSTADAEFAKAIAAANSLGLDATLVQAHERYAEVLEARGDLVGANRHLRLALASSGAAARSGDLKSVAIA